MSLEITHLATHVPFAYSDHHLIKLQVTFGPTNPRGQGDKRLNLWISRTLSLKGKSLIINSISAYLHGA